jgi:ADP-ribose pyrophosphatase
MMPEIVSREPVFSTPWFDLVAKTVEGNERPYYSIRTADYVCVMALTANQEILLVRQYRAAVEKYTVELPSGHLEPGEDPAEAARRELLEETGYAVDAVHFLGSLTTDAGRLSNRMWCYFADSAVHQSDVLEEGVALIICDKTELARFISDGTMDHSLHLAPLLLAVMQGKLALP